MSGPKSSSYDLAAERRREEAARRAAVGRARAVAERLQRLGSRLADLSRAWPDLVVSVALDPMPPEQDRVALERWAEGAAAALAAAEQALDAHLDQPRLAAVLAAVATEVGPPARVEVDTDALRADAAAREAAAVDASWRDRARTQAVGALSGATGVDEGSVEHLRALAEAVADSASEAEAAARLRDLETRLDEGRRVAERRSADRSAAGDLLAALLAFDEAGADPPVVTELRSVLDGGRLLTSTTIEAAEAERSARQQRADDLLVRAEVAHALEQLGYAVGERFTTLAAGEGLIVAPPEAAAMDGFAVRVLAEADGRLRWHVVRDADRAVDGQADLVAEERWCEDLHRVHDQIAADGIRAQLVSAKAPGEVPVLAVAGLAGQRSAVAEHRRRRRRSDRAQERGR